MSRCLLYCTCFWILFIPFESWAQNPSIFKAHIVAGITAAQIDGDNSLGFNKPGLTAGLKVEFPFAKQVTGNLGLFYSMRGSQGKFFSSSVDYLKIHLNYVDVPFTVHVKDWFTDEAFYKVEAYAGIVYGRLISASAINSTFQGNEEYFNKNNWNWTAGALIRWSQKSAGGASYTRGLNKLYKFGSGAPNNPSSLLSYFISIYYQYTL